MNKPTGIKPDNPKSPNTFIRLFALACMFCLLLSCSKNEEPVKIGAIIPLTGPASQHKVFVDAIGMAVEKINRLGGIRGRGLRIILEDSETNPQKGIKAFQKLETEHHPLLYLSTTSVVTKALAPLAEKNQVVLIGLAAANPMITRNKKWVFKFFTSPEYEIRPIMDIIENKGMQTLGVLYQNDPFGSSHYEYLKTVFENKGGTVMGIPFDPKKPDFNKKVSFLEQTGGVYIVGFVRIVEKAIKIIRSFGYKGIILAHSGATSLSSSMPELDGVYVAAPIIYNPNYPFIREVKNKYESKYEKPFTHQAANGYDIIKIITGLMEGQELTREKVRMALEDEFSYPGISGFIEKKAGEHDILFPLYPAYIDKNKILYLN
jgi:branched-chain amino acid transport system substrate-binding protein